MSRIFTNSGIMFDLLNPDPKTVDVAKDVSYVLARLVRFNGHAGMYSVAEHCVLASHLVEPEFAMQALLHDAQEAYTGDISTPCKRAIGFISVEQVENGIHRAICEHIGVTDRIPPEVLEIDEMLYHTESLTLFKHNPPWVEMRLVDACAELMSDRGVAIEQWSPSLASRNFHSRLLSLLAAKESVGV